MNRPHEEIAELYDKHEKLVHATVHKRFGDPSYMKAHGLSRDDLIQYGRIGLFNACKTYDKTKRTSFRSHAINNIVWFIQDEAKRDSLNNINNSSNELLEKTSMDVPISDDLGEVNLHDIIEYTEVGFNEFDVENFLKNIGESISQDLEVVVRLRMSDFSFSDIGAEMGISKQAASQLLKRNREKLVKLYQEA